jgi:hypothetical protein
MFVGVCVLTVVYSHALRHAQFYERTSDAIAPHMHVQCFHHGGELSQKANHISVCACVAVCLRHVRLLVSVRGSSRVGDRF